MFKICLMDWIRNKIIKYIGDFNRVVLKEIIYIFIYIYLLYMFVFMYMCICKYMDVKLFIIVR